MKNKLFILTILCSISFASNAQKKGQNILGFGINRHQSNSDADNEQTKNTKTVFNLNYGYFITDNQRVGMEIGIGNFKDGSMLSNSRLFNSTIIYQRYIPIYRTFSAYLNGLIRYELSNNKFNDDLESRDQHYVIGVGSGVSWFASKRIALEMNFLGTDFSRQSTRYFNDEKMSSSTLKLKLNGFITDPSFKIYFLL
ncbi:MAG: hypothetical protein EOO90_00235 [Pedobacter sp.]|nr:MAG: hypothetical protein EOO90_00235 [Pedobacter sp.]